MKIIHHDDTFISLDGKDYGTRFDDCFAHELGLFADDFECFHVSLNPEVETRSRFVAISERSYDKINAIFVRSNAACGLVAKVFGDAGLEHPFETNSPSCFKAGMYLKDLGDGWFFEDALSTYKQCGIQFVEETGFIGTRDIPFIKHAIVKALTSEKT